MHAAETKPIESAKVVDNKITHTTDAKNQHKQLSSTKSRQLIVKSWRRIAIIRDSMLNGIYEEGMEKDHNVKVKPHSGVIRGVVRKKPECVIIHAGTNDLTSKEPVDTARNFNTMIEDVKLDSLGTIIVLSTAVMRMEKQAMDRKVSIPELNRTIKEIEKENSIPVIENSNLDMSCLSRKKLHLNEQGNSFLANNLCSYLKNHFQRVKIGSHRSTARKIKIRVPQGLVLGPLLFNIFINNICLINLDSEICNFADDNTLYS